MTWTRGRQGADKGLFLQSPFFVHDYVLVNEIIAVQTAMWLHRKGAWLPRSYNPHLVMCSQTWPNHLTLVSLLLWAVKIHLRAVACCLEIVSFKNTICTKQPHEKHALISTKKKKKEEERPSQRFPYMWDTVGRNSTIFWGNIFPSSMSGKLVTGTL